VFVVQVEENRKRNKGFWLAFDPVGQKKQGNTNKILSPAVNPL
jgi:hypothetical protein